MEQSIDRVNKSILAFSSTLKKVVQDAQECMSLDQAETEGTDYEPPEGTLGTLRELATQFVGLSQLINSSLAGPTSDAEVLYCDLCGETVGKTRSLVVKVANDAIELYTSPLDAALQSRFHFDAKELAKHLKALGGLCNISLLPRDDQSWRVLQRGVELGTMLNSFVTTTGACRARKSLETKSGSFASAQRDFARELRAFLAAAGHPKMLWPDSTIELTTEARVVITMSRALVQGSAAGDADPEDVARKEAMVEAAKEAFVEALQVVLISSCCIPPSARGQKDEATRIKETKEIEAKGGREKEEKMRKPAGGTEVEKKEDPPLLEAPEDPSDTFGALLHAFSVAAPSFAGFWLALPPDEARGVRAALTPLLIDPQRERRKAKLQLAGSQVATTVAELRRSPRVVVSSSVSSSLDKDGEGGKEGEGSGDSRRSQSARGAREDDDVASMIRARKQLSGPGGAVRAPEGLGVAAARGTTGSVIAQHKSQVSVQRRNDQEGDIRALQCIQNIGEWRSVGTVRRSKPPGGGKTGKRGGTPPPPLASMASLEGMSGKPAVRETEKLERKLAKLRAKTEEGGDPAGYTIFSLPEHLLRGFTAILQRAHEYLLDEEGKYRKQRKVALQVEEVRVMLSSLMRQYRAFLNFETAAPDARILHEVYARFAPETFPLVGSLDEAMIQAAVLGRRYGMVMALARARFLDQYLLVNSSMSQVYTLCSYFVRVAWDMETSVSSGGGGDGSGSARGEGLLSSTRHAILGSPNSSTRDKDKDNKDKDNNIKDKDKDKDKDSGADEMMMSTIGGNMSVISSSSEGLQRSAGLQVAIAVDTTARQLIEMLNALETFKYLQMHLPEQGQVGDLEISMDERNNAHIWKDEKLEARLRGVSSDPPLKALKMEEVTDGNLNLFVRVLTDQELYDQAFADAFIHEYQSFTSPYELFEKLVQRYDVPADVKSETKRQIRTRITIFLLKWVQTRWEDFDPLLLEQLDDFADKVLAATGQQPLGEKIRKELHDKIQTSEARMRRQAMNAMELVVPQSLQNGVSPVTVFLNTKAAVIAEQLCLIDWFVYSTIQPVELVGKAWERPRTRFRSPGVVSMSRRQDSLAYWLMWLILYSEDAKVRAGLFTRCVKVCEELIKCRNFLSLSSFVVALTNTPVSRLEAAKGSASKLKKASALVEMQDNFAKFRQAYKNATPPAVPHLTVFMKDLTSLSDGVPDECNGGINWHKRALEFSIISEFLEYQGTPYPFTTQEPLRSLLSVLPILQPEKVQSKLQYELSRYREPPRAAKGNKKKK